MKALMVLTAVFLSSNQSDPSLTLKQELERIRAAERPTIDAAITALENTDHVQIFALDSWGAPPKDCRHDTIDAGCFMGWRSMGSAAIEDTSAVTEIRLELLRWLRAPEPDGIPMCFFPHHGVRINSGESKFDFAICYACDSMQVFRHQPMGQARVYLASDRSLLDRILIRSGLQPTGLDHPE